jgi:hypothetical protein
LILSRIRRRLKSLSVTWTVHTHAESTFNTG